jgi:hypothetical protein
MKWMAAFALPILVVILPTYAHAALVVTKVMSNPIGSNAGRQWVEFINTGTDPINLGAKNIRFFTPSGNHLIKAYEDGGTIVPAGGVVVIAQNPMSFLYDLPNYTGLLLKSAFTLPTSGFVGVAQTDGTVLARESYEATPTPKPAAVSKSTIKRATTRTTSGTSKSHLKAKTNSYGKGTVAPDASADAAASGAVFAFPSVLGPLAPLITNVWFAVYIALVAFSGFSLLVIQRHYYL